MLKKAIILLSLGMVGAFVFVFFLDQGETKPLVTYHRPSIQNKTHGDTKAAQKMNSENAYAAIVLIPKSYLPALERFKRSNMGKLIQILPAKLEWRDGEMTAVMKNHKGNSGIKIEPKKEVSPQPIPLLKRVLLKNEIRSSARAFSTFWRELTKRNH